jgi:hypothetical protein
MRLLLMMIMMMTDESHTSASLYRDEASDTLLSMGQAGAMFHVILQSLMQG